LMPNRPSNFENIVTPSDLDVEINLHGRYWKLNFFLIKNHECLIASCSSLVMHLHTPWTTQMWVWKWKQRKKELKYAL
jgi:uncharacterized membrane protein